MGLMTACVVTCEVSSSLVIPPKSQRSPLGRAASMLIKTRFTTADVSAIKATSFETALNGLWLSTGGDGANGLSVVLGRLDTPRACSAYSKCAYISQLQGGMARHLTDNLLFNIIRAEAFKGMVNL